MTVHTFGRIHRHKTAVYNYNIILYICTLYIYMAESSLFARARRYWNTFAILLCMRIYYYYTCARRPPPTQCVGQQPVSYIILYIRVYNNNTFRRSTILWQFFFPPFFPFAEKNSPAELTVDDRSPETTACDQTKQQQEKKYNNINTKNITLPHKRCIIIMICIVYTKKYYLQIVARRHLHSFLSLWFSFMNAVHNIILRFIVIYV